MILIVFSTGVVDDATSFSNRLAQGDTLEEKGAYVSSLFTISWVNVSTIQVDPTTSLESTISFADDIADHSFCGVSDLAGIRAREGIKVPSRYRSPASKKNKGDSKKSGVDKFVQLLRIRPEDIGVTICGGKFDKMGIHACAIR